MLSANKIYLSELFCIFGKNEQTMTTAELKLNLFRQIDNMDESHLEELFGIMSNYIASRNDLDEWSFLSEQQQEAILSAIEEAEANKLVPHETVIEEAQKKLANALQG
jgi:predicted transcriptional regulator